ncbi:MAG: MBL fold metallo-hydrolase, partial [bacterium]|nr:MBL fold metallo-hydrolase [bacterium]
MTRSFPMGSVIIIIAATFLAAAGCRGLNCYPATAEVALAAVGRTETYTIWQLPAQTHTQMMAYVLRTAGGRVVVIDGGTKGDAPYLKGFLAALGNRVDAWFITHSHGDHAGALTALLEQSAAGPTDAGAANGPAISAIYAALPPEDRLAQFDKGALETQRAFLAAVAAAGRSVTTLSLGQVIEVDGLRFEILGVAHP